MDVVKQKITVCFLSFPVSYRYRFSLQFDYVILQVTPTIHQQKRVQENYYSTDSESDEEVEEVEEVENDQPAQGEVVDVEIKEEPVESEDESQSNTTEPQSAKENDSQMVRIILIVLLFVVEYW